jgi:hypothetical protein
MTGIVGYAIHQIVHLVFDIRTKYKHEIYIKMWNLLLKFFHLKNNRFKTLHSCSEKWRFRTLSILSLIFELNINMKEQLTSMRHVHGAGGGVRESCAGIIWYGVWLLFGKNTPFQAFDSPFILETYLIIYCTKDLYPWLYWYNM